MENKEIEPEYIWNDKKYRTLREVILARRKARPWYKNLILDIRAKYYCYKFRIQDYFKK